MSATLTEIEIAKCPVCLGDMELTPLGSRNIWTDTTPGCILIAMSLDRKEVMIFDTWMPIEALKLRKIFPVETIPVYHTIQDTNFEERIKSLDPVSNAVSIEAHSRLEAYQEGFRECQEKVLGILRGEYS